MEHKHTCASICNTLPTLSANHPWLNDHNNLEDDNIDHIIYTIRDPLSQYRCPIPLYIGRHVHGCLHGWVILSNNDNNMWYLWNPVISEIIRLPPLVLKTGERGGQHCCLSSSPDDHGSIFMLTTYKPTIIFCRLDCKRKKLKWVEMSYAKQTSSIRGYSGVLSSPTCFNGKVFALNISQPKKFVVVHIDIAVKGSEIVISLLPYMMLEMPHMNNRLRFIPFLKGCCEELFYIGLGFYEVGNVTKKTVGAVCVLKLDMENKRWEQTEDLEDAAFFLDLTNDCSHYSPSVAAEIKGHVHFLDICGKVINSYDLKNKTIALSSMPTSHTSLLEHRLQGDLGDEVVDGNSTRMEENMESRLLDIPLDVLKTIMEFCVGVEYLNLRATCKQCHLAAPMIQWNKGESLHTSPWLMVLHKDRGVISFTDPMLGNTYFIKTPQELLGDFDILCSMYGWLLIRTHEGVFFFNPFTSDSRKLPTTRYLDSYCFSAPPTSYDCKVVGFRRDSTCYVYVHFVARKSSSWRRFRLNFPDDALMYSFYSATLYRQNRYAFYNNGGLEFIEKNNRVYTWRKVLAEGPRSSCGSVKQKFLMKCDQHLLLAILGEFGKPVEVFKLNDSTEWEIIESLGKHTIYIGARTCLCIEAKTPVMANKIFFPRLHLGSGKIVFYSLETRRYHTFGIEETFGDFMGTKHHLDLHTWVEPSWS